MGVPADVSQVLAWGMDLPAFRGKVYHLMEPDQVTKAKFESWLKQTAMQECMEASEGLSEPDRERVMKLVISDISNRQFRWGGPKWSQSMQTGGGMEKIISLLLRDQKKREVNPAIVADMLKDDDPICKWLWASFYVVCGMDPTLALAAADMTLAKASNEVKKNQELLNQIMQQTPESLSKTSPSSGTSTANSPTGKSGIS